MRLNRAIVLPLLVAVAVSCGGSGDDRIPAQSEAVATDEVTLGTPGGRLVTALRSEPGTFNPLLPMDNPSRTVASRLHSDLVHIDRRSQETVAALAESVEVSEDGTRYTVKLRRGVLFSDGEAFDADDVVFTYAAVMDETVASPNRSLLIVEGEPLAVRKVDSHTVEFRFAAPYAVGDRMFDGISILPEHRLGAIWRQGRLTEVWGTDTAADEIVGLGPFRLASYRPGEQLALERNPHYWKTDAAGRQLPYLDQLVFLFVGSEDAEAVRLQSGELDLSDRLNAQNFAVLSRTADRTGLNLEDLGPSLEYDFLFFNLNDLSDRDLPQTAARQSWFRDPAFRHAVSSAIDRGALARLAYDGKATPIASHVTPANRLWRNGRLEAVPYSPQAARDRLSEARYSWSESGDLLDGAGVAVEFTLITSSSNSQRVRMATLIQEDLRQIGVRVSFVPLEFRALLDRVLNRHDFEACLLGLAAGDVDPNSDMPVWLSDGGLHLWDLSGRQPLPGWQSEIDSLLRRQVSVLDRAERRRLYDRVQEIAFEQQPLILLVSPNVLVAAKRGLGNFRPAVMRHSTLWNAEELFWRGDGPSGAE